MPIAPLFLHFLFSTKYVAMHFCLSVTIIFLVYTLIT